MFFALWLIVHVWIYLSSKIPSSKKTGLILSMSESHNYNRLLSTSLDLGQHDLTYSSIQDKKIYIPRDAKRETYSEIIIYKIFKLGRDIYKKYEWGTWYKYNSLWLINIIILILQKTYTQQWSQNRAKTIIC